MTVYLDKRAEEDPDKKEEEQEIELAVQKKLAAVALAKFTWHFIAAPIAFFLLWNSCLTPVLGIGKIGYLKSLGILTIAAIVRGGPKFEPNE